MYFPCCSKLQGFVEKGKIMWYRTHTKFRGINFRALAWSEFCGSIFSCGVIFVDRQCLRSEINFQLHSYTEMQNLLEYPPKWSFLLLPLGYHVSWTHGRGTKNRAKPNSVANCWTMQGSLLYAWKYNKPCMCQENIYAIRQSLPSYVARP